jgi:hypothetical protein
LPERNKHLFHALHRPFAGQNHIKRGLIFDRAGPAGRALFMAMTFEPATENALLKLKLALASEHTARLSATGKFIKP